MEPLQRHYQLLQGHYRPLHSGYGAVTSHYGAVTHLTSRYGVGRLQRACALQRHSLRSQPSSEGLAPWVVPSAPLPQGGFSVVSLQGTMYAAGSEKEKRAGGRLHGGTIAQLFVFCKGELGGVGRWGSSGWGGGREGKDGLVLACALHQRRVWLGVRRCPTGPPSNVFRNRGTRCTPRRGLRPLRPAWGTSSSSFFTLARPDPLPSLPPTTGAGTEPTPAACSEHP